MAPERKKLIEKARALRAFFFDVDGTLTDGTAVWTSDGHELIRFSKRDGKGISMLRQAGVEVGLITGSTADCVLKRAHGLGITIIGMDLDRPGEKLGFLESTCNALNISLQEVGYMGDDVNDLEVMHQVGFTACPSDAEHPIVDYADLFVPRKGGHHAARYACDFVRYSKGVKP